MYKNIIIFFFCLISIFAIQASDSTQVSDLARRRKYTIIFMNNDIYIKDRDIYIQYSLWALEARQAESAEVKTFWKLNREKEEALIIKELTDA